MSDVRRALGCSITLLALTGAGLAVTAAPAHAAPETCRGQVVTIVATNPGDRLTGTDGDDVISTGGLRSVKVDGGAGDDLICASARKRAVLDGGAGDDTLVDLGRGAGASERSATRMLPGPGADRYVGLPGTVLTFDRHAGPVLVDLAAGTVTDGHEVDRVAGLRHVVGSPFQDTFDGSADDDVYQSNRDGRHDRDVISTGAGDDQVLLVGGTADLGPGDDLVSAWAADVDGGGGRDRIHLQNGGTARGGSGADRIEAVLDSDDEPFPGPGFRLLGGPGDDRIQPAYSEHGTAFCPPLCVVGVADGGEGRDTLDLRRWRTRQTIEIDLGRRFVRSGGDRTTLARIEDVEGSRYRDVIRGDSRANHLDGNGGDDVLMGRVGRDRLHGGPGRDRAIGGAGLDRCEAEARRSC